MLKPLAVAAVGVVIVLVGVFVPAVADYALAFYAIGGLATLGGAVGVVTSFGGSSGGGYTPTAP